MALRDTLRKAASLLVELPPEEPSAEPAETPSGFGVPRVPTTSRSSSSSELNDLLAQLEDKGPPLTAKGPVKTVEQIARDTEGPNLDQITSSAAPSQPLLNAEGKVDFQAVYQQAGVQGAAFNAEQMLDMLSSLPADLPLAVKRQTVNVSLNALGKTIGASPETIVADASRKLAALSAYVDRLSAQTAEQIASAELEIAALQAQIEEKRRTIATSKEQLERVDRQCDAESDRLDDVLEFFSLDVAPSKYAQPGGGGQP